jgi:hypothetical protein
LCQKDKMKHKGENGNEPKEILIEMRKKIWKKSQNEKRNSNINHRILKSKIWKILKGLNIKKKPGIGKGRRKNEGKWYQIFNFWWKKGSREKKGRVFEEIYFEREVSFAFLNSCFYNWMATSKSFPALIFNVYFRWKVASRQQVSLKGNEFQTLLFENKNYQISVSISFLSFLEQSLFK